MSKLAMESVSHLRMHCIRVIVSLTLLVPPVVQAQDVKTVRDQCDKATPITCAGIVLNALKKPEYKDNPRAVLSIAEIWNAKYSTAYYKLKVKTPSERDVAKIEAALDDKLSPVSIAKDKAIDAIVKKYLSRLATVIAIASSAPVEAIVVFLTPSEVANDYDELRLTNKQVQDQVQGLLFPYLQPSWKDSVTLQLKDVAKGPMIGPKP